MVIAPEYITTADARCLVGGALGSKALDHSGSWIIYALSHLDFYILLKPLISHSQKILSYRLLANVIEKLDRTPATTSDFQLLRKLLFWLATAIEILFPWLEASATIKEGAMVHELF